MNIEMVVRQELQPGEIIYGSHGRGRVVEIRDSFVSSQLPYGERNVRNPVIVEFDCGYRDVYDTTELQLVPFHSCNCIGLAELIRSFGFGDDYVRAVHRLPIGLNRMRESLEIIREYQGTPQDLRDLVS